MSSAGALTLVLFVKYPRPGAVKTRLSGDGGVEPETAAAIAAAMAACTLQRLAAHGPVVAAVSPDGCGPALLAALQQPAVPVVDQGAGTLGDRLARVWRSIEGPVAFFGIDSPDVPDDLLAAIDPALRDGAADVVIGPTLDGGYWTLAAPRSRPELLAEIDWGTASVYDQTLQRARETGLRVHELPPWHDVDEPADLEALRKRLSVASDRGPLERLARRLDDVCGNRRDGHD